VSYLHERQISPLPVSLLEAEIEMLDDVHAGCHECDTTQTAESIATAASGGIGRRTFLVQSGILAAIAALSACGLSGGEPTAPDVPTNSTIDVNNYPSLANVGGVAMVTLGSAPVAIVRTGSTSFLALSRICLHQGGIVQLANNDFVCPVHGATYDLSGKWIGGQRAPSLHQYSTSYDQASGTLTIG
jgi:nitrite reductase/ring-hydroxylating ferredoxin subunit